MGQIKVCLDRMCPKEQVIWVMLLYPSSFEIGASDTPGDRGGDEGREVAAAGVQSKI